MACCDGCAKSGGSCGSSGKSKALATDDAWRVGAMVGGSNPPVAVWGWSGLPNEVLTFPAVVLDVPTNAPPGYALERGLIGGTVLGVATTLLVQWLTKKKS